MPSISLNLPPLLITFTDLLLLHLDLKPPRFIAAVFAINIFMDSTDFTIPNKHLSLRHETI